MYRVAALHISATYCRMKINLWGLVAATTAFGACDGGINDHSIVTLAVFNQLGEGVGSGLPVAFLDGDGNTILETETDADGFAAASMPNGGSVTVGALSLAMPFAGEIISSQTWIDVKPGDNLVVAEPPLTPTFARVHVTIPTVPDAVSYTVHDSCGTGTTVDVVPSSAATVTIDVALPWTCTSASFLVNAAFADTSSTYFFVAAQPLARDQAITLSDSYTAPGQTSVQVTGLPSTAFDEIYASVNLYAGSNPMSFNQSLADPQIENNAATIGVQVASAITYDMVSKVNWSEGDVDSARYQVAYDRVANSYVIPVDVSSERLPTIGASPMFNAQAGTVTWTEAGAGTPDTEFVTLELMSADGTRQVERNIIAPSRHGVIKLPTMPDSLAMYNALPGDQAAIENLQLMQLPGGYDTIREQFFSDEPLSYYLSSNGQRALLSGIQTQ